LLQGVNLKRFRTEYWLSSIKIATVVVFIITGTLVHGGLNREHKPIGLVNWTIGDAPFVGGLSGFATVFVAAAMSCENRTVIMNCIVLILQQLDGGTESLAISAGETKDPSRTIPRVVRIVFWRSVECSSSSVDLTHPHRIVIFYLVTCVVIGLNGK